MELERDTFFGSDPGNIPVPQHDDSGAQHVEFYHNKVADKPFCRITFPGDRQKIWDQPVRDVDKQRYHRIWTLFQEGKDQLAGQTMLKTWGDVDEGSIEVYNMFHIQTVEQLANLTDQNLTNLPVADQALAIRHRQMARQYVTQRDQSAGFNKAMEAATQASAVAQQAQQENQELREQIAKLQQIQQQEGPRGPSSSVAEKPQSFPKFAGGHGRGAKYELSDGSVVVGKVAAVEAEKALSQA